MFELLRTQSNVKMRWTSVWATISVGFVIFGSSNTAPSSGPVVKLASYQIVKKPVHTVSDKFLSFTADPNSIARVAECSSNDSYATLNMAKSLTPAYFRVAGVDSNRLLFQSNPNLNHSDITSKSKTFPVTNQDWLKWNNFLSETGMSVIACVSGETEPSSKGWDLTNTLELITFSDKHNISLDWQLGYELQKLASSQGKLMGREVTRLRKILDLFPRYRKSLIIGPDMTNFRTQSDAMFVRNYLAEAGDSLNVFTWHPFSKGSEDNEILEMLSNGMNSMDNYLWIKDGAVKSSSKGVIPKKSIWIAESESTETVSNLSDTMTWIMKMGAAAKIGASVYLRRPHLLSFYEPTPEYWTAVLYKSLVGRTVLHMKQTSGNNTNKIHMFTHCTKFIEKPEESIINPEFSYDPGSITVYGVNMASESTRISFKIGYKGDETAHLFVLTEDASGDFPKTLLNKQPLGLSSENQLPVVSPRVRETPRYLLIPARSIFFIVFPNTKCRSCNEYDASDTSKTKIQVPEEEDLDTNTFTSTTLEVMEDENDHDTIYVNYPKRTENAVQISDNSSPSQNSTNSQVNTKYVTFSSETWMNQFPEQFKDIINKEKDASSDANNKKRAQMYRILAQAMLGKRPVQNTADDLPEFENPATRFVFEEDNSESKQFKRALKNFSRFKRSSESVASEQKTKEVDFKNESLAEDNGAELFSCCDFDTIYLFDKKDEEIRSLQAEEDLPVSNIYIVPLTKENYEEVTKSKGFSESIPVVFTVEKSTLRNLLSNSSETVTWYLFDQKDDEILSLLNQKRINISNLYAVCVPKGELSDVIYTKGFNEASNVTFYVKESSLLNLLGGNEFRTKRETNEINPTTLEAFSSLFENSTIKNPIMKQAINHTIELTAEILLQVIQDNGTLEETMTPEAFPSLSEVNTFLQNPEVKHDIDGVLKDTVEMLTQFIYSNWFAGQPGNGSFNWTSTRHNLYHITTLTLLNKIKTEDPSKNSSETENLASKFILQDNEESEKFNQVMKNFDRSKRWTNPADKMESPIPFTRSTLSKIRAIPLNEDSLQEAMKSNEFQETIPIITFLPRTKLDSIVEAVNSRSKRETSLENVPNAKVPDNSTNLPTTSSPSNSPDEILTQSTTSQSALEESTDFEFSSSNPNTSKEWIGPNKTAEIQPNVTLKPNLQQENSSLPDLANESDDLKILRELREVAEKAEAEENITGNRHFKTMEKPNYRPVSPFPKKLKNVKSKSSKNKAKSSNNVELSHQDMSTPSALATEPVVSAKRRIQHSTLSSQSNSSDLGKSFKTSDESEDELNDNSTTITKLQPEITELHHPKQTLAKTEAPNSKPNNLPEFPQLVTVPAKIVSKLETNPSSSISAMVGTPLSEHNRRQKHKPVPQLIKKPKITPEQLRLSYEQKKKELLKKHFDQLNKIRSLIGKPALPIPHMHMKRSANTLDDAVKGTKDFFTGIWDSIRSWDPKHSWIAEETTKISDAITKREVGYIDEDSPGQLIPISIDVFKNSRPKRNTEMVVSPKTQPKDLTLENFKKLVEARTTEQKRQIQKIIEEKKVLMKARLAEKPEHSRNCRGVEKPMCDKLREKKQKRKDELRQKLAKQKELEKKTTNHESAIVPERPKRDLESIRDKIHELQEKKQQKRTEFHRKIDQRFPDARPKIPHTSADSTKPAKHSLVRNKRDAQTIHDKIQEIRQKKQEQRQALNKKAQIENSATVPPPTASNVSKSKIVKIDEPQPQANQHPASSNTPKNKLAKIDEPQPQANQPSSSSNIPKSEIAPQKHQNANKISKKDRKSTPIKENPHHRLSKKDVSENQLELKATSPADLQKNFRMHLFADPELNTPQSMLDGMKYDDLDRLRRSLNNNEIDEDDDFAAKVKNKGPMYDENSQLKLNQENDFVFNSANSTPKSLIDLESGDSKVKSDGIEATATSQENQTCELSNYNLFKYLWCLAQKLWYTCINVNI